MAQPQTQFKAFRRDIIRTRRLLNRLPDAVQREVVKTLEDAGPELLAKSRVATPVKTGRLRNALKYRVLPKSLRAQLGIIGKRLNRDLFYGWILEVGRKAGPSKHRAQRRLKGGGYGKKYKVNMRAISPNRYDIVQGRIKTYAKQWFRPRLAAVFERALRSAQGGN